MFLPLSCHLYRSCAKSVSSSIFRIPLYAFSAFIVDFLLLSLTLARSLAACFSRGNERFSFLILIFLCLPLYIDISTKKIRRITFYKIYDCVWMCASEWNHHKSSSIKRQMKVLSLCFLKCTASDVYLLIQKGTKKSVFFLLTPSNLVVVVGGGMKAFFYVP